MKIRIHRALALATAALALGGCVSLFPGGDGNPPAFAVADPPLPEAAPSEGEIPALIVIGRVRAAPDAAGRALRAVDADSGRAARYAGGDLAVSPEALVARRLRRAEAARHPGATVCDSALAPRHAEAALLECWIEDFRLERQAGAWTFRLAGTLYRTTPGTDTVACEPFASAVPVAGNGAGEPPPAAVAAAITAALAALPL